MNDILSFPWGILMLLFISFQVWIGKRDNYLRSLNLTSFGFLIAVFCLLLGSWFSPLLQIGGNRIYLNLGAVLGLVLPSLYFLTRKPWQSMVRGWLCLIILVFLNVYIYTSAPVNLHRFLPFESWIYILISAIIAVFIGGYRKNIYGALFLAIWISQLYLGLKGYYGFWEIINIETLNLLILAVLPIELLLAFKTGFKKIRQRKYQLQDLSDAGNKGA